MSEEAAPGKQRRVMSPGAVARKAERLLVIPFRARIAELQTRVAFLAARGISRKTFDRSEVEAGYSEVAEAIERLLTEVDAAVSGEGLGPAEDCRRALRLLRQRIPSSSGETAHSA